jgi:peptidylprolyl isomerase
MLNRFKDLCPEACDNFTKLCTGSAGVSEDRDHAILHYKDTRVHRIVPGGWFQCGDLLEGTGAYSTAAVEGGRVRDECFSVDFNVAEGGIVGYSSSSPHGNGSQFFITFGPCEWMQNSFVGFGRVVVGLSALSMLEAQPTSNQAPVKEIVIANCGIQY